MDQKIIRFYEVPRLSLLNQKNANGISLMKINTMVMFWQICRLATGPRQEQASPFCGSRRHLIRVQYKYPFIFDVGAITK